MDGQGTCALPRRDRDDAGLASSDVPGTYEPGWVDSDDANIDPIPLDRTGPYACGIDDTNATWTPSAGGGDNLPMNYVSWAAAYAFCIWDGGFLPSEAELEYAAAGGDEQRQYPWGSTDPGTGPQYAIFNCSWASPVSGFGCPWGWSVGNIAPVGSAPSGAGRWGQLDLTGELSAFTLDHFAPYVSPCADCADVAAGDNRTARGGIYYQDPPLLPPVRKSEPAFPCDDAMGFRCARVP